MCAEIGEGVVAAVVHDLHAAAVAQPHQLGGGLLRLLC